MNLSSASARLRVRRPLTALMAIALAGTTLVFSAVPAFASTTTLSSPVTLSGSQTLSSTGLTASSVLGVTATADLIATLNWTQAASIGTTFDPNLVRQGRPLDPSDSYIRTGAGALSLTWSLSNLVIKWDSITVGPFSPSFNASGTCDLKAAGGSYVCSVASSTIGLIPTPFGYIGPYADVGLAADVTVSPEAIATLRTATFGGNPDGTASLSLGETPITDSLTIPCTAGAGDEMTYGLGTLSSSPGVQVDTNLVFDVGAAFPDPIIPFKEDKVSFGSDSTLLDSRQTSIDMSGAGPTFDFGAVQPNNIAPVPSAGGPYSGDEGSPVSFDGSASSSICGDPILRWDFSDGGVAFGPFPQHTFADDGVYSGLLTATDVTGLTAMATFSVTIDNLPPSVTAGPSKSSLWGLPVAFHANGSDPGPVDNVNLLYTWDFGDAYSPVGAAGQDVSHTYNHAGTYTAQVTVTDNNGVTATAQVLVAVLSRATTTAYTGPLTSLPSKNVTLTASLVDELGQPVVGRAVTFTLGSQTITATTDGSGVATASIKLNQKKGTYSVSASFAGDSQYGSSSNAQTFTIGS